MVNNASERTTSDICKRILDSTLAGYWDWFITEDFEYLSPTFKKMLGYEIDEMDHHPDAWMGLLHKDDLSGVMECYNAHIESKGKIPYINECRYWHKSGNIIWILCRGEVIEWDEHDNPVRMIGSHTDITALKSAELELQRTQTHLVRQNEQLLQFSRSMAHDLLSPARSIEGLAQILKEDYLNTMDEVADELINNITMLSVRIATLIEASRVHLRVGNKLEISRTKIKDIVYWALDNLNLTNDPRIKIKGGNQFIKVDPVQIGRVFQNLISNAVKFSEKNTDIVVKWTKKDGNYIFTVADKGIGIEPKYQHRIFNVFERLDTSYEGTGMGLAICKKIVEYHNGTIQVKSEPNNGSVFEFILPHLK